MNIDKTRIERNIEDLASIGMHEGGGITRLEWTEENLEARKFIIKEMKEANLRVSLDSIGNIIGKRDILTENPKLPSIMVGSHIDTPKNGGKYDGTVGVLGGLEVIRMFNEHGIETKHPIEVVVFAGEEASRFGASFKGSMGMIGQATPEIMRNKWVDKEGISYWEALKAAGFDPEDYESAVRDPDSIKCYYELHIEQGRVLEQAGVPIGVVTCIAGVARGWATIQGRADHSGATPMNVRKDALAAAAEIIIHLEEAARKEAYCDTVATVGDLIVRPSAMNVIPGEVTMSLEVRGTNVDSISRVFKGLHRKISEVSTAREIDIRYQYHENESPRPMSPESQSIIKQSVEEEEVEYILMPSGAGHDAQILSKITRAGMIFVPSINGISHSPKEVTKIDDIVQGVRILAKVVSKEAITI